MRAEAQVPGPRRPSAEATAAPVTEAAIVETPIVEAPVAEAAAVESAVMEETPAEALTATPSLPAPMETVGGGDGPLWAAQVEEVEEEQYQHSRPAKHPRLLSRRQEPASQLPFPLQDHAGRFACHVAARTCCHTTRRLSQPSGQGDQALAPRTAATPGHKPREPSGLHDCRVSFNGEHSSVEPPPNTPT